MSLHSAGSSIFSSQKYVFLAGKEASGKTMSELERQETLQDTGETYPLVALKNMVVFPRTRMTLAIAREKSVRAVEEAMMGPGHTLIASAQRDPEVDDPQPKDIYPTGTLVEITTIHHQQDGSMQI